MNPDAFAVVLYPNGTIEVINRRVPYGELSAIVGGYIEAVMLYDGKGEAAIGYINEEGKTLTLPRNAVATWAFEQGGGTRCDYIAGPMVIVGVPDDEGEDTPIPGYWLTKLGIVA